MRSLATCVLALSSMMALCAATEIDWNPCSKKDDEGLVSIDDITLEDAEDGKGWQVGIDGSIEEKVADGTLVWTMTPEGGSPTTRSGPFCDIIKLLQIGECPMKAGKLSIHKEINTGLVHAGTFHLDVSATNKDGDDLFCVNSTVTLSPVK
ncbi:hypothetical protein BC940DRAFT_138971 [Gongronella butleri]|nr:hypothetical protein BC940DRAFT_138971 [Gongronella butleri]